MSLVSSHGVPMLTDHGYSPIFASWIIGVLGASSIAFTLVLGGLSDRFGARPVLSGIYAGRALIFAGLFLIRDNPLAILGVAIAGGINPGRLHVDDVHAHGGHLWSLLGGAHPGRDLPRAPDRRRAGLLAGGRAVRVHGSYAAATTWSPARSLLTARPGGPGASICRRADLSAWAARAAPRD